MQLISLLLCCIFCFSLKAEQNKPFFEDNFDQYNTKKIPASDISYITLKVA